MSVALTPYIDILRTQLESSLVPRDESAKKVALYSHRMLTVLGERLMTLPVLQSRALDEFDQLLDSLLSELGGIDGGMILIPQLMLHIRSQPNYAMAEPFLQRAVGLLAEMAGGNTSRLMADIAGITCRIQEGFKQAILDKDFKPSGENDANEPLSAAQKESLCDYLRRTFPKEDHIEVGKTTSILGGGSKLTLIVELKKSNALPPSIVLRVDKSEGVVDSTVADEFNLIKAVFEAGVPAPKPFAVASDTSIIGSPFIVVSKVEGHNIGDWIEVLEPTREFASGLARALAILHSIPVDPYGGHLPGAKITHREQLSHELKSFEKTWRAYGEPSIGMEQAIAWVKSHMDFAEGRRAIVHCDAGCHNMLGHDGKFAALLDWETAIIDNPARDIAYTRPTVMQMMPWEDYLAEYENAGGILPGEMELDFYRVWCALFSIHYQFMARSFFFSGMSSSLIHAYATQHLHQHMDYRLHQEVKRVYEKY